MFSLVITIISIALVAALALATLYYGGNAFNQGHAAAEAAKLRVQGQQLIAAAELYYARTGVWMDDVPTLVAAGYLKSVPLAQVVVAPAWAATPWGMPTEQVPVFMLEGVDVTVCQKVNEGSYGLPGVLTELRPGFAQQCFGRSTSSLKMVVSRSSASLTKAANTTGSALTPSDLASGGIPSASEPSEWLVPPEPAEAPAQPEPETPAQDTPAALVATPSTIEFESTATHTTESLTVTVGNTGTLAAVLTGAPLVSGNPDLTIASTTCAGEIAGGGSCEVVLSHAPTEVSSGATGTLSLAWAEGEPLVVSITANSYNPVSLQSVTLPEIYRNIPMEPFSFADYLTVANESNPNLAEVTWRVQDEAAIPSYLPQVGLPAGFSLDPQTGVLSGTAIKRTELDGQSFTVIATYKNNENRLTYTIKVGRKTLDVVQIAAGDSHTCALTPAGGVKCWGWAYMEPDPTRYTIFPKDVPGLTAGVTSIAVGRQAACAITTGGGAKCWGLNTQGQLGNGSTVASQVPVDVVGLTSGVQSISIGDSGACAVTTGGGAKCWGARPGNGASTASSVPVNVTGLTSGVSKIAIGYSSTCAITTGGAAKCWGYNFDGLLGNNSTTHSYAPVDVSGLSSGVVSIAVGNLTACAVRSTGAVVCWGNGSEGTIGDGGTARRLVPTQVSGLTSGYTSVAMGDFHACARSTAGGIKCWGLNDSGQLGDGTYTNRLTPVAVTDMASGTQTLVAGGRRTCAMVSNTARCWGKNTRPIETIYREDTLTPNNSNVPTIAVTH